MSKPETSQECWHFLNQLAAQDSFLGTADQQSQLTEEIEKVSEAVTRLEKDISSKLDRLVDEADNEFIALIDTLKQSQSSISDIFDQLSTEPKNAQANIQASIALSQQLQHLSRTVRPRMLRVIDKFSPRYKVLEKTLDGLPALYQHMVKPLSEFITLIFNKQKPEANTDGQSIFELEFAPRQNALCRPAFLASTRYSLLSASCHRKYRQIKLPFRKMAMYFLLEHSNLETNILLQRHQSTHNELFNRLTDAWRAVRYNLETASTELEDLYSKIRNEDADEVEEKHAELATLCLSALKQCLETLDDVKVTYTSFLMAAMTEIADNHQQSLQQLAQTLSKPSALSSRAIQKISAYNPERSQHTVSLREFSKRALDFLHNSLKLPGTLYKKLVKLRWFNRVKHTEESLLQLADLPTQAELVETAHNLPPIYRRMFHNEPLMNREFLVGMEDEFSLLESAFSRWRNNKSATVAIIGPEGSGKTSLINCFENDLDENYKVIRYNLRERLRNTETVIHTIEDIFELNSQHANVSELAGTICKMGRQIIILEGGHNLLLRKVGARDAVDAFFHVLMSTRSQVFWIVSFRMIPWVRMSYMYQVERYFTHIVKSEVHNKDELRNALMLRQRVTGQAPAFSTDGINNYKINKLMSRHKPGDVTLQAALSDYYFSTLYEFSGGNMNTALYYWLQSLQVGSDGEILVKPCNKVDMTFIKNLDHNYLFTLAEILIHGELSIQEHCNLFGLEMNRSRLILEYLRQIRLLQSNGKDRHDQPLHYSINTLFFQPITSTLKDMHILY